MYLLYYRVNEIIGAETIRWSSAVVNRIKAFISPPPAYSSFWARTLASMIVGMG